MKGVIITSPALARELLKDGDKIIDIKPNKKVQNGTIFVFADSENVRKKLEKKRKQSKN